MSIIKLELSIGEIFDKVSILCIKLENIKNVKKIKNIKKEYDYLKLELSNKKYDIDNDPEYKELLKINKIIWLIEDDIRKQEKNKNFDKEYIAIARSVYIMNDKRCYIKMKINDRYSSKFREEKSYTSYDHNLNNSELDIITKKYLKSLENIID